MRIYNLLPLLKVPWKRSEIDDFFENIIMIIIKKDCVTQPICHKIPNNQSYKLRTIFAEAFEQRSGSEHKTFISIYCELI